MGYYKIYFTQLVKQREFDRAYVKANSEEEAIKKLKNYEYDNFETDDIDVIDVGEFEDIEVVELED